MALEAVVYHAVYTFVNQPAVYPISLTGNTFIAVSHWLVKASGLWYTITGPTRKLLEYSPVALGHEDPAVVSPQDQPLHALWQVIFF